MSPGPCEAVRNHVLLGGIAHVFHFSVLVVLRLSMSQLHLRKSRGAARTGGGDRGLRSLVADISSHSIRLGQKHCIVGGQ